MGKNLQQNERGIGHILMIILALVVVAAIGVGGWKVASNHKSSTTNSSTSATSNKTATTTSSTGVDASCLSAYHDATLCRFAANSTAFEKAAYTATIATKQNGTPSTLTLKSDGKGDTELTGAANGQQFSSITLGGITYVQAGNTGSWIQYPTGSAAPVTNPTSNMNIGVGNSGVTFKALGTAACGSLTCYKYQVTDSATPNATQYALFDKGSYKLREWQYTDASGNTTTMNVSYETVSITKPSPVESLPSVAQ